MAKPIPKPKLKRRAGVRKKVGKKKQPQTLKRAVENSWMVVGFDQSASSIAGAAIAYDHVLRKMKGPVFMMVRWQKDDHYFSRLAEAGKSHEFILDLQVKLGVIMPLDRVWIAQEEPFPPGGGFTGKGISNSLKQQAEISGALLSGFLRYGFNNLWQIGNYQWRGLVADELGITIHHTKWNNPTVMPMPSEWNFNPKHTGKFRAKQWALENGMPSTEWPDIIESGKLGKIPRPEKSKARAVQSDDRYEALAIMEFLVRDLAGQGAIEEYPGEPPGYGYWGVGDY